MEYNIPLFVYDLMQIVPAALTVFRNEYPQICAAPFVRNGRGKKVSIVRPAFPVLLVINLYSTFDDGWDSGKGINFRLPCSVSDHTVFDFPLRNQNIAEPRPVRLVPYLCCVAGKPINNSSALRQFLPCDCCYNIAFLHLWY